MTRPSTVFSAAVLVMLAASPARAQIVHGTVLDTLSGNPVGHGFVVLLDSAGNEVARTLSRADGRFTLRVPAIGVYSVRSERIGYRVWDSQPFRLSHETEFEVALRIASLPAQLEAIEVIGETSCRDPSGNVDAGALWEEARKALAAASWTANRAGYMHLLHMFRTNWNARRTRVESEEIGLEAGQSRLPFAAVNPVTLEEEGYVVRQGGSYVWYAPDAAVLLDEGFHRTHCFNAIRGEDEFRDMLGLEFEPAPDRRLSDIAGTLWIDERSSELRRIEYRYMNTPSGRTDDRVGGTIVFHPLSNGAWIVERWVIRIGTWDLARRAPSVDPLRSLRGSSRPTGYADRGGQVIELYDLDGNPLFVSPELVVVHGTVFDSIRGGPLVDEMVRIVGTGYTAVTDENGQYVIRGILKGEHRVTSGRLDSLGYLSGTVGAELAPGTSVELNLAVPPQRTVHLDLCSEIGIPEDQRALVGLLRDANSSPVEGIWIGAVWNVGVDRSDREMRRVRTDETGRYVLCNVPVSAPMQIEVLVEGLENPQAEVRFRDGQVRITRDGRIVRFDVPDRILRLDFDLPPDLPTRRR